ncbi:MULTISPECIES: hypothetical protein [unclassified Sulfuricurvum]|uniref:hypothetical protein n=1 Tax=unclassified Sulfuricurvum TaxID=2632390 RepID=UPI00029990B7|nr:MULTISPECIES: hypothetical protein [unclassified Sulfuricurvum]AFV96531.1 hypothetical protein B649_01085 [Candidatus Sulfuricurvum sp. RIFRC-1]HBM35989.1 hypothetical protein [Sulfuricurvum sp.]
MLQFFILWVSILLFLITGCSTKHYTLSEPKIITLKTPKLKFADTGYIRHDDTSVEVELFTAGVAVEKIAIDDQVCVSVGCMSEEAFVKEYLNPDYPRDTMRNVLLGKDIFAGRGKEEMCDGRLLQFIRNDEMDIVYRRGKGEIYFKDRLNSLIIKIEDLDNNQSIP